MDHPTNPAARRRRADPFRLRPPGRLPGAALVGLAVVLVLAAAAVTAAAARPAPRTAGPTATVEVYLLSMRIQPATVRVPAGTHLLLRVTNHDVQAHDLRAATGAHTRLLAAHESQTLDLGTVTATIPAWCTVTGHRAAGMAMTIGVGTAGHDLAHGGAEPFTPEFTARDATLAPAPAARLHTLRLPVVERDLEVAPGVIRRMWTFGGTVPGPTIRAHLGDVIDVTLVNQGTIAHGIDFHAGGISPDPAMHPIAPGATVRYRFVADRAGVWLYHCSAPPMTQHIGNGMFGVVIVDPPDLAPVDREYLLVDSELYLDPPGSDALVAKLRAGTPDGWAFNGVRGQYDRYPLTARAGDRVRVWVLAAGPGSGVAFHIVGTRFDTVYKEGGYLIRGHASGAAQVLDLVAAQGGYVEAEFAVPGRYALVDHDMRRAEAGAHGFLTVTP